MTTEINDTLAADETDGTTVVRDSEGGVWWPSDEAAEDPRADRAVVQVRVTEEQRDLRGANLVGANLRGIYALGAARTLLDTYETDDDIRLVARWVLSNSATPDEIGSVVDLADAVREEVDANGELRRGQESSERLSRLERALRDSLDYDSSDEDE